MHCSVEDAHLSRREIEVLTLVIAGHTNKVIAVRLQVCEKTIEFHLKNIYDKINVNNKVEAAVWAVRNLKD